MNADPHDTRKQAIEDAMISAAEDAAQVAAFGKAAFDRDNQWREATHPEIHFYGWAQATEQEQLRYVAIAQAVLAEAGRMDVSGMSEPIQVIKKLTRVEAAAAEAAFKVFKKEFCYVLPGFKKCSLAYQDSWRLIVNAAISAHKAAARKR